MKYLLALLFIILLGSCGGSSKKNHNFKATVIDGYLIDSNISIYDKDSKLLSSTITDDTASFSYRDTKNDFLYIRATSGIDTMNDEVFSSSLYGVATKGTSVIISPLSSLVWAYHTYNHSAIDDKYKKLAENIQDKLKLTKDILTFDPIANISDKESSKIIKTNITLEFVARLFNAALGGNFEHIVYAYSYIKLLRYEDLSFLYSDSFIDDISNELPKKYNYINEYIVNLKLTYLQSIIAYVVNEIDYLEADNQELLKKNYKASYILTLPIIKEASLMQNIKAKDTSYTSEYFNDINSKIKSLDMNIILNGLKILGGFRGILYRINDINRETKTIKSSYYSNSFLNKKLLAKSSVVYHYLSGAIVSGAPSQEASKDFMLRNTIFSNMENQDIFDSKIAEKIQNQVSLLIGFSKENTINTNAELYLKEEEINANKKDFDNQAKSLVSNMETDNNNALFASKIDTTLIDKSNKENLTLYKDDIYVKYELEHIAIQKQNKISELIKTNKDEFIIRRSSELELIILQEDLLKEKINKNRISKKIIDYKTKLSITDDEDAKAKIEESLKISENSEKSSENTLTAIKNQETRHENTIHSITDSLKNTASKKYARLLKEHTEIQEEEQQEQDILIELKRAKKIYDRKIKDIEDDKKEAEVEYEANLNILSKILDNGEEIEATLLSTLRKELRIIESLERKLNRVRVTKKDLAKSIDFTIHNLKSCISKDDHNLFSITISQSNRFIKTRLSNIPQNTIFSNNALKRKEEDGINSFYMPLGDYNISITVTNTDTDADKSKSAHFQIKETCNKDGSLAFKAPLQIPNIPNLAAPELNISDDIPNPNSGQNPPKIGDGGKPPKDN